MRFYSGPEAHSRFRVLGFRGWGVGQGLGLRAYVCLGVLLGEVWAVWGLGV